MSDEHLPATVSQETSIVRASGDVVLALAEYQSIQKMLDKSMPDCIQTIETKYGPRQFRKKSYWRAIATAFNLTLDCMSERRETTEGDWGWIVTYQATAKNGRSATGDGACFASEKYEGQQSEHNVRSHAHTRAYNRAVSNLVGFGEVSAEEVQAERPRARSRAPLAPASGDKKISEAQGKRFWALAAERAKKHEGVTREEIVREVLAAYGLEHTQDIPWTSYDKLCSEVQKWDPPVDDSAHAEEPF